MNTDEILDKLSQEERIELLEQLIKGAAEAKEENLTVEERVERLENLIGLGSRRMVKMTHGGGMHGHGHCCG